MSAKIKGSLFAIVSLGGNVALLAGVLPSPWKWYVLCAFNLVQVIYAFFDPTYHVELLGKKMEGK